MAISNKEKFLQQKNEIRSIRYFYSGTDLYDTYKDVEKLAEKQGISADFLYDLFAQEPIEVKKGLETYIARYKRKSFEEYLFIQILRYKQFWKVDTTEEETDKRYFEATGKRLLHTDLSEEEINARVEEWYKHQEEERFRYIKSTVCNDYYRINKEKPIEEDVWMYYRHMETIREELKGISDYLSGEFKIDFEIVDNAKYEDALNALQEVRKYLSHCNL